MNSLLNCVFLLSLVFIAVPLGQKIVSAVGGIAELKTLTGDAPYLGTGNQEQAPEYFSEAAYRQYYKNFPYSAYGYGAGYSGIDYRNRYGYNTGTNGYNGYNGMYNSNLYQLPYRNYQTEYNSRINLPYQQGLSGSHIDGASRSSYYTGAGNDWA